MAFFCRKQEHSFVNVFYDEDPDLPCLFISGALKPVDALDLLAYNRKCMLKEANVCKERKQRYFWLTLANLVVPMILKLMTLELGIIKGNLCVNTRLSVRSQARCMRLTKHRSQEVMYTNSQGCTTTIRILLNSDILSSMHMVRAFTYVVTLLACHVILLQVTFLLCTGLVKGCY